MNTSPFRSVHMRRQEKAPTRRSWSCANKRGFTGGRRRGSTGWSLPRLPVPSSAVISRKELVNLLVGDHSGAKFGEADGRGKALTSTDFGIFRRRTNLHRTPRGSDHYFIHVDEPGGRGDSDCSFKDTACLETSLSILSNLV